MQRVTPAAAPVKRVAAMGKAKKFRAAKVRAIKRTVNPKHDPRLKDKQDRVKRKEEKNNQRKATLLSHRVCGVIGKIDRKYTGP